ncbi:MAG TPA: hypothetical protein VHE30_00265 [Polyangiaceae bacterium]|nr:hypothetical protein [Polyangiaceae bacterium]
MTVRGAMYLGVRGALVALTLASVACNEKRATPNTTSQPSPNASLLPAPLASTGELTSPRATPQVGIPADSAGRLIVKDPEPPPPEPMPVNQALSSDTLTMKDTAGYSLEGAFHWADLPPLAAGPEVVPSALKDALSKSELSVAADLAIAGRLRIALESAAFPLPTHSELRARTSYYGHVLAWPDGTAYRLLPPGSLRAMFAERRADVTPLLRAKVTPGASGTLLGHKTSTTEIETSLGALSLEQATLPGSGGGGELLCRFLVELVGAEPTTEACRSERIPLSARYRWTPTGSLAFTVRSLSEKKDLSLGAVYVPPAGAVFSPGTLPPKTSGVFLTQAELAKFRSKAVRAGTPGPKAPGEGITVENATMGLTYLLLDGVPVAWLGPKEQKYVIGPVAGHYSVAFRDFFGAVLVPPQAVDLPAFVRNGSPEPDGGAR